MMTTDFKRLALEIIENSSKGATWYNLEVAFSRRGYGGDINALKLVEILVEDGFLIIKSSDSSTLQLYQVTDAGRKYLRDS